MWRLRVPAGGRCGAASLALSAAEKLCARFGHRRLFTSSDHTRSLSRCHAHLPHFSSLLPPSTSSARLLFSTSSSHSTPGSSEAASLPPSASSPSSSPSSSSSATKPIGRARRGRGSRYTGSASALSPAPPTSSSPVSASPPSISPQAEPPERPASASSTASSATSDGASAGSRSLPPTASASRADQPSSSLSFPSTQSLPASSSVAAPPRPSAYNGEPRPVGARAAAPPARRPQPAAAPFVSTRFSPAASFTQSQAHSQAQPEAAAPSSLPSSSTASYPPVSASFPTELSAIDDAELSGSPALPSSPFPRSPSSSSAYSTLPPHESTYVSTHYHVDVADVHSYLRRKGLSFRASASGSQLLIRDCPFCHPISGKADNQYKLTIYFPNADHFCHRCKARGSWFDLKRRMGDLRDPVVTLRDQVLHPHYTKGFPAFRKSDAGGESATGATTTAAARRHRQPSQQSLMQFQAQLGQFPEVVRWLTEGPESGGRGLRRDLLDFYHVGAGCFRFVNEEGRWVEEECVTFPWMRIREEKAKKKSARATEGDEEGKETAEERSAERSAEEVAQAAAATASLSPSAPAPSSSFTPSTPSPPSSPSAPSYIVERIKYRSRVSKANQRLLPAGGNWGFFGYHIIPASATSVILTEGEFDAIAAYQCTGVPAISLPNGANSLPVELLPFLERFSNIYLWMDDDRVGQEGAETFAKKLGIQRCLIVRTRGGETEGPKDANDALLQGYDLGQLLAAAAPLPHDQITTFTQLRDDVWKEIADPQQRAGVQSTSLPSLNRLLKGHRRGELTIITGATGVGKTTVLSQMSLDFCAQGVVTLWGSFEIKNFKLAKTMLSQLSGVDLSLNAHHFDHYADQFERLPMYFMRFFGSSSVEQVLDAMDYAVYMHDVQHVVLDNLQFMLTGQGAGAGGAMDRFELQDRAISEFRHFATHRNVHITIVIHPRKEAEQRPLSVSSVFGSAKATQEADNVIILQAPTPPSVIASAAFAADNSGWMRQKAALPAEDGGADDFSSRFRRLQVSKNRYDGEVGTIPFLYDRPTGRIQEVDKDGSIKHRATFARVTPAPIEGIQSIGGGAERRKNRRKGEGEGGEEGGVVEAAAFEGEVEEDEALPPAPPMFRPAPLFTPPSPASMLVPAASPHLPASQAPVAAFTAEHAEPSVDEEAVEAGDAGEEDGMRSDGVRLQQPTSAAGRQRRWGRAGGDPHRSNPPFEFIA